MASSSNLARIAGVAILLLGALPVAEAMTEFSAEVDCFNQQGDPVMKGEIYVSDDVIREEVGGDSPVSIRITDLFRGVSYLLDTVRHEYQERQEVFTVPRNPSQFCAEMALMECGYQEREQVNGVETEHWRAELGFGSLTIGVDGWYDPKIQYPLRIQWGGGRQLKLSKVKVGRIPSALLSIPFDYQRVDSIEGSVAEYFSDWP